MNLPFSSVLFGVAVVLAACGAQMAAGPQAPHEPEPMVSPVPIVTESIMSDAGNPPAPGFNAEGSDTRAIEVADRVMARLGGRAAWDETRYLTWRFFGGRRHVWDKWTGDHRLEDGELIVLSNLHDHHGRAWRSGEEIVDPDTLAVVLDKAYASWINDSYWLVMPYKLKDSGVTLTYQGEGMTEEGLPAHILELRFQDVGRTPQNRYQVWVDIDNSLVRQWAFYGESTDENPRFVLPWANWQPYGNIWLNDDFGRKRHTEVSVLEQVADIFLTGPEKNPTTE